MNADGSDARRDLRHGAEEVEPAWSPDGSVDRLRPARARDDRCARCGSCARTGRGAHALTTPDGASSTTPAWSPDSSGASCSRPTRTASSSRSSRSASTGRVCGASRPPRTTSSSPPGRPTGRRSRSHEDGAIFTVELGGGDVERAHGQREQRLVSRLEPRAALLARRRRLRSERPEALVRLERRHAVADGQADLALRRGLLLRLGEHVLGDRVRHDHDAVVVADDPVARLDRARGRSSSAPASPRAPSARSSPPA